MMSLRNHAGRAAAFVVGFAVVVLPADRAMHAQVTVQMNTLAERYVRLVLALGQHDADYVDAYYGPAEWKMEAQADSSASASRRIGARPLQDLGGMASPDRSGGASFYSRKVIPNDSTG